MSTNEQKAQQLVAEAEKKLGPRGFFGSLFGGSRVEDAIECYQRAANLFKMAKNWPSAGSAFNEAANLHLRAGSRHEAATNYVDAANCYKKSNINDAVTSYIKAIDLYTDMGRFSIAAKHHQSIAEMYENEAVDIDKAVQHYEQAADFFMGEESNNAANKCLLKVAQYAAQHENYSKAIQIYQEIATSSLESSLLKYSAKEYFFKAALCQLCIDHLNAQHALDRYVEQYPAFQDSREFKLLANLIENVEEQNVDGFTDAVKGYDSISRLDEWLTTLLLRVKRQLGEKPDLC
ncbi:alpha-soluble NSF attachment protein isoform X1 [Euwallacea fornicatus]|uniref:alpha-soluble NSF attachment protein isoform X1 n=1 Tax=Euwallacea fornicatus TaxID=995702 RepID=UPI00338D3E16